MNNYIEYTSIFLLLKIIFLRYGLNAYIEVDLEYCSEPVEWNVFLRPEWSLVKLRWIFESLLLQVKISGYTEDYEYFWLIFFVLTDINEMI